MIRSTYTYCLSMKRIIPRVDHRALPPKARDSSQQTQCFVHVAFGATRSTDPCSRDIFIYYVGSGALPIGETVIQLKCSYSYDNSAMVGTWWRWGVGRFVSERLSHSYSRMTCQAGSGNGDESSRCRRHLVHMKIVSCVSTPLQAYYFIARHKTLMFLTDH